MSSVNIEYLLNSALVTNIESSVKLSDDLKMKLAAKELLKSVIQALNPQNEDSKYTSLFKLQGVLEDIAKFLSEKKELSAFENELMALVRTSVDDVKGLESACVMTGQGITMRLFGVRRNLTTKDIVDLSYKSYLESTECKTSDSDYVFSSKEKIVKWIVSGQQASLMPGFSPWASSHELHGWYSWSSMVTIFNQLDQIRSKVSSLAQTDYQSCGLYEGWLSQINNFLDSVQIFRAK